jgi:hypothetical protein
MIGLLQELGPCRINNDSASVTLNPFSWNNNSNMLFIDQPVGVGFSHGTESVGSSQDAAADIWSFLQIFLKDSRFSKLATNDLAIWTESSVVFCYWISFMLFTPRHPGTAATMDLRLQRISCLKTRPSPPVRSLDCI